MTSLQVKTLTNPVQRAANSVRRAAFTLVELMIVILIIGLLAGIATPVIFTAMTTARQFTIINETQQINAAVERFRTDHGFYPPTFNSGAAGGVNSLAQFRTYLNRIAPNNSEVSSGGLAKWWAQVGSNLDQRSGLVFWLSGLANSKQYPLSGTAAIASSPANQNMVLAPYNANLLVDGITSTAGPIDRNVFFEFKSGQLVSLEDANGNALSLGIKGYSQPNGKGDPEDLVYLYRDFRSYISPNGNAYHSGEDNMGAPINFFNPTTFQLVSPGMDGSLSQFAMIETDLMKTEDPDNSDDGEDDEVPYVDSEQDDNIVNFTSGRLDQAYP